MTEPDHRVSAADLLRWAETLSGIARTGLGFTQSLYERERFEEVLKVAADIRVAAGYALDTDDVIKVAGPASNGMMFTQGPDPRLNPASKMVVDSFKAANQDPEGYTLYTYAAVQVWAQAVTQAKSTEMTKVTAALRSGHAFNTVMGPIKLDKKGDVMGGGYVFWKFDNNKKSQIAQ